MCVPPVRPCEGNHDSDVSAPSSAPKVTAPLRPSRCQVSPQQLMEQARDWASNIVIFLDEGKRMRVTSEATHIVRKSSLRQTPQSLRSCFVVGRPLPRLMTILAGRSMQEVSRETCPCGLLRMQCQLAISTLQQLLIREQQCSRAVQVRDPTTTGRSMVGHPLASYK